MRIEPQITQEALDRLEANLIRMLHSAIESERDQRIAADRRYEEKFEASEKAIVKAEFATEKRFEGVNEFRSTLGDQARLFMPRAEAELGLAALKSTQMLIQKRLDETTGAKAGSQSTWAYIAAAVGLGIGAITWFLSLIKP